MEKKRSKAKPASLLIANLHLVQLNQQLKPNIKALDLACGNGRNGRFLADLGAQVSFIDQDLNQLPPIPTHCNQFRFDLENGQPMPFPPKQFDLILVFNYLHRPLFSQIKDLIKPDGFIIYETFITEQAKYGRPTNPDFLLNPNELKQEFAQFHLLHYVEGNVGCENKPCFKAQLIAQKVGDST